MTEKRQYTPPNRRERASEFFREVIASVLPTGISVFVVDFFFLKFRINLGASHPVMIVLFLVSISALGNLLFYWQAKLVRYFVEPPRLRKAPESRWVAWLKGLITVVVIPILLMIAFEMIKDPVERLISNLVNGSDGLSGPAKIANAVLSSREIETKKSGIIALGQLRTPESTYQLKRILESGDSCFLDSDCYEDTVKALTMAQDKTMPAFLLSLLQGHLKEAKSQGSYGTLGPTQESFKADFGALRAKIVQSPGDSNAKKQTTARLDALETQLNADIGDLKTEIPKASQKTALVELILDTYIGCRESKSDGEANLIAQQIADDDAYPISVRARAITLVGRVGQLSDEEWLLKWIDGRDESIKPSAIDAFVEVDLRFRRPSNESPKGAEDASK